MAWSNIDSFNEYLSLSYGRDSHLVSIDSASLTTTSGTWSPAPNNLIAGTGGNATVDFGTNTYIYWNYRVFKVLSIKSNNLVELDKPLFTNNVKFYTFNQTLYPTVLKSDTDKIKALYSAEVQITGSPEYTFPATVTNPMKYGLYEWAVWLLDGGTNQSYEDRRNGLISKTVDVLQWQWDKNAVIYSGPASAQKYLEAYRNPNFEPGLGASSTTFSF